jgi:hypothetical protein
MARAVVDDDERLGLPGTALAGHIRAKRFAVDAGRADDEALHGRACVTIGEDFMPADLYPAEPWLYAWRAWRLAGDEAQAPEPFRAGFGDFVRERGCWAVGSASKRPRQRRGDVGQSVVPVAESTRDRRMRQAAQRKRPPLKKVARNEPSPRTIVPPEHTMSPGSCSAAASSEGMRPSSLIWIAPQSAAQRSPITSAPTRAMRQGLLSLRLTAVRGELMGSSGGSVNGSQC